MSNRMGNGGADEIPEQLLPSQMIATPETAPERRLMIRIFEDAIDCYFGRGLVPSGDYDRIRYRQQLQSDAERWFDSNQNIGLYDFLRICDELGLDSIRVRRALREGRARVGLATRKAA